VFTLQFLCEVISNHPPSSEGQDEELIPFGCCTDTCNISITAGLYLKPLTDQYPSSLWTFLIKNWLLIVQFTALLPFGSNDFRSFQQFGYFASFMLTSVFNTFTDYNRINI